MAENTLVNTEDPLARLLRDNQSTGLGTRLTDAYTNLQLGAPIVSTTTNSLPDTTGLGSITPSLSNDYFKMQMLKPGETENKDMFLGMNPTEWSSAMKAGQLGLGGANLGLGILGYFQNKGLADKQKEVLGQQIESNRAEIDARKNYRSALEKF